MREYIDLFLHLDRSLNNLAAQLGGWLYALLFAVIFAETGLVVTPFLPGDSLLFAVGALAATEGAVIDVWKVGVLLFIAAVLGDAVNYTIGKWFGPKVFNREDSWLLNKKHLMKTHEFYERHGGKTIILARFMPIIRTFAPFVAGIGEMTYARFAAFNVIGALVWISSFLTLGYFFGNLPQVKKNFTLVILGIIVVSCIPIAVEWWKARKEAANPPPPSALP